MFFFATVHEGSYGALIGVALQSGLTNPIAIIGTHGRSYLTYWAMKTAADQVDLHIDSPSIHDLSPEGAWMEWANSSSRQLPAIPYYNAYGSIEVKVSGCVWKLGCADVPFMSGTVGDAVILAGNDPDPYDGPSILGGSRFKPNIGTAVEWEMKDTVRFNAAKLAIPYIGPAAGGEELAEVIAEVLSSPVMHTQLPSHTGDISVASCGSGGHVVLADEVIALIENRAGAGGYQCQ